MFAWLINHTILYVIVFFWGYFTLKLFYHGLWGIIVALFLGIAYYDVSSKNAGFFTDVIYILGALDYKFYLREQASSYLSFAWQVGADGVKENIEERIQLLKNKFSFQRFIGRDDTQYDTKTGFDKHWYDEELERERQKAQQAQENARRANEQARRAKEEAERAKRNSQHKQQNQGNKKALDPTKLKDAYEILGVEYGTDKATCKKNFKRLMALYHPDKLADFTGSRRAKMEQEAKDIGVAWETVRDK